MNWDLYGFAFGDNCPLITLIQMGVWCDNLEELQRTVRYRFDDPLVTCPVILATDPRSNHVIAFNR